MMQRAVLEHSTAQFEGQPDALRRFRIVRPANGKIGKVKDLLRMDAYSAACGFVQGEFSIEGDIIAAMKFYVARSHPRFWTWWYSIRAALTHARGRFGRPSRKNAARYIQFHYDRSNEFYRQFLDSRMLYSSAYFADPAWSLEEAQAAKLEQICRKLRLRTGERFLDVGCGWGGLIAYAAQHFDVQATGCTLSHQQAEFARKIAADSGLEDRVAVLERDYRDMQGRFDKVASVGMFEHAGYELRGYFRKIYALLADQGLFLNSGILRSCHSYDGPETLFLQRNVFPGGKLMHLADVIREAERAGFQVLRVENLNPHYALTCRRWVERLQANEESCRRLVDERTYRTWLLYLAASAVSFERGRTDVAQVLMAKNNRSRRGFQRETMSLRSHDSVNKCS
ncbi:MAG: cyclopropane-fatty-acyl-phospholipid synthase family protein [Bryobacteraceae bacterium]